MNTYRIQFSKVDEKGLPTHTAIIDAFTAMDAISQLGYALPYGITITQIKPLVGVEKFGDDTGYFAQKLGRLIIDNEEK